MSESESEPPAYEAVTLPDPDEKPRHEWSYVQRRADILRRIEEAGHPDVLTKTELAREYDVSHTTIGRDFDRLAEYVGDTLGERHAFIADRVFRGAILNLVDDGEHYKAAQTVERWYSWLSDVEAVPRAPERREVSASLSYEQLETDSYEIVIEDD